MQGEARPALSNLIRPPESELDERRPGFFLSEPLSATVCNMPPRGQRRANNGTGAYVARPEPEPELITKLTEPQVSRALEITTRRGRTPEEGKMFASMLLGLDDDDDR